ncbi:nucleoside diphosphate-linked moiety X motif 8, mitochondrial [Platysternon megacephalum]|uniref:Nucleoside diphosphate-linked moiety X motif 8, mitochondrial n=1 Tax=Platysternon megacephalum TaxID=55544 RepID=A0A4D9DPL1_9SAUR|nr:nucleoside diphosphate-linked moiety X motif 8, mitochondrial [Platysternon megacephalum]
MSRLRSGGDDDLRSRQVSLLEWVKRDNSPFRHKGPDPVHTYSRVGHRESAAGRRVQREEEQEAAAGQPDSSGKLSEGGYTAEPAPDGTGQRRAQEAAALAECPGLERDGAG